jgi:Raf kinase inhibitor-like YbhB/YbcL family protein
MLPDRAFSSRTQSSPSIAGQIMSSLPSIRSIFALGFAAMLAAVLGCGGEGNAVRSDVEEEIARIQAEKAPAGSKMRLTSTAFEHRQPIPKRYTSQGDDVSPPLAWEGAPKGTVAFALLLSDPDAPSPEQPADKPWSHWVLYDLPGSATELPEGLQREAKPLSLGGALQGLNSWPDDNVGYRGPDPPPGSGKHRYVFTLYALGSPLALDPAETTYDDVLTAMNGHILDSATLIGTYEIE